VADGDNSVVYVACRLFGLEEAIWGLSLSMASLCVSLTWETPTYWVVNFTPKQNSLAERLPQQTINNIIPQLEGRRSSKIYLQPASSADNVSSKVISIRGLQQPPK